MKKRLFAKKTLAMTMAALMAAGMLAGCGGGQEAGTKAARAGYHQVPLLGGQHGLFRSDAGDHCEVQR